MFWRKVKRKRKVQRAGGRRWRGFNRGQVSFTEKLTAELLNFKEVTMRPEDIWMKNYHELPEVEVILAISSRNEARELSGQRVRCSGECFVSV